MSTAIRKARYNADERKLRITFTSNTEGEYEYSDVPVEVYRELTTAESAGRTFNAEIRDRFPVRWVRA